MDAQIKIFADAFKPGGRPRGRRLQRFATGLCGTVVMKRHAAAVVRQHNKQIRARPNT
ncbi:MAG: hypothetical protein QM754_09330 [Tepidisphaeraceae bacterium]